MTIDSPPADDTARAQALDPARSFIVQAPAGSGKTELLTRRFLILLATVNEPEEILAITFTRKAAGEMRARIVEALELAAQGAPPAEPHRRITRELARAAFARDAERGWQLARHPARLRIQTLDSLNAELTRRMPLLSQFGAQPGIAERPAPLYEEAARRTLEMLEDGDARATEAVAQLLRHLDNHVPRVLRLIAGMLPRRDQWLRHTGVDASPAELRRALEAAVAAEIRLTLRALRAALSAEEQRELAELAVHAGRALRAQAADSIITRCAKLESLPADAAEDLPVWQAIAELLLTKDGEWRARVDKRQGFAPGSDEKIRMDALLSRWRERESLRAHLARVRVLPPPHYPDAQWRALEALLVLLPLAAAQLQLVFAEAGQVDYAEVALRALQALGSPTRPTDLALALDYRLRHILVDEFQDTSFNQFALLERLTAGWQNGDGRTLFLVGDPMQSIYRFREAEVGLFLRARESGIGGVKLDALTLSANFRSQAGLVDWFNAVFSAVLPTTPDIASGAVPYAPAESQWPARAGRAVQVHAVIGAGPEREAQCVCRLIESARRDHPQERIAVLARGRAQLAPIARRLRESGVAFRAVELESLGERPVVQDLLSLTRALLHAGDRTAWLAALRAPWCGLSLAALHALVRDAPDATVPELLRDGARVRVVGALAADTRFRHARDCLLETFANGRRGGLRAQVENLWLRLGAPATLAAAEDLADAQAYFELLGSLEQGGGLESAAQLENALSELFAQADPGANESLQLMTIHKAKGLEFDTVIVPGLGYGARRDQPPLLAWLERPRASGGEDLLLAPLHASGGEDDPLYRLVRRLQEEQQQLELGRLLYVACTRARSRLHLLGHAAAVERDGRQILLPPRSGSLLKLLWPMVRADFEQALAQPPDSQPGAEIPGQQQPPLRRLRADWQMPPPLPDVGRSGAPETLAAEEPPRPEFEWAGDTLRHVGTVVHRLLQRVAQEGTARWPAERLRALAPHIVHWLRELGVPEAELAGAARDVERALHNTLSDDRGRWILDSAHTEARCEYALSAFEHRRLVTGVIDRSFVDNDGVRWIIDYKTGRHEGADRETFLRREAERYRPQLARYARLLGAREARIVKAALYFPLLAAFHPVELD